MILKGMGYGQPVPWLGAFQHITPAVDGFEDWNLIQAAKPKIWRFRMIGTAD